MHDLRVTSLQEKSWTDGSKSQEGGKTHGRRERRHCQRAAAAAVSDLIVRRHVQTLADLI